jgi:replicative DNA helicase
MDMDMDMEERVSTPEPSVQTVAEASMIGAVLRNRGLMADLGDVSPSHFMEKAFQESWRRMMDDASIDDDMSLRIAVPDLSEEQVRLVNRAANHRRDTVLRARTYIFESRARKELRRIYMDGLAALDERKGMTASDIAGQTGRSLVDMSASATVSTSATAVARVLEIQEKSQAIRTGIRAVDYVTYGGLHLGQLTGVFARYKVGKTVLMATLARNLEQQGVPTLMVSLERRKHDVERFIVARSLGIDARDLDLRANKDHISAFAEYLEDRRQLWYIHKPGVTIDDLRAMILAEVHANKVRVVLVDYWQLITNPGSKSSQQEKQQESAQMLADLAATLDISIVVTGQINQEGQPRGGEGILASGGIVIAINRPDEQEDGFVSTMVSNKGPSLSKGDPLHPSISLILPGPHFADYEAPV